MDSRTTTKTEDFLSTLPRTFKAGLQKGYTAVVHMDASGQICVDFDNGMGRLLASEDNVRWSPEEE